MTGRTLLVVGCLLAVGALSLPTATATDDNDTVTVPPEPGTTDSDLSESEAATLWATQPPSAYKPPAEYRDEHGTNRTMTHEVADGVDLTFSEPPSTAREWTQYAHDQYDPGGHSTAVYPEAATRHNGSYIKDAHATVFAVTPSTQTHVEQNDTRRYIAPEGELLGTVDFRVETPPDSRDDGWLYSWRVADSTVEEVRLETPTEVIETKPGTKRPVFAYNLTDSDPAWLRLAADIEATIEQTASPPGTDHTFVVQRRDESLSVKDSIDVERYDLTATVQYADYPDGRTGVSVAQNQPWQGYSLDADGTTEIRGTWRFFTARDTGWDELTAAREDDRTRLATEALPVSVHAYPSRLQPRAKPDFDGPEIRETWGEKHETPAATLPENVSVGVVEAAYRPTSGMVARADDVDIEAVTVTGIVYGTEADIVTPYDGPRPLRASTLSTTVLDTDDDGATVLVELREADSGDPIQLDGNERRSPIVPPQQRGHIELAGQQVETNASGQATVTIESPGTYTARYEPQRWLSVDPAYVGDDETVRWHPLTTFSGWVGLFSRLLAVLAPFLVALYAGRKLGTFTGGQRRAP